MGFFQFPYTNFHELNLDFIIKRTLETEEKVAEYKKDIDNYKGDITNALSEILNEPTLSEEVYKAMAKYGAVVNVKSYGAVGDGETDDLEAFTNCLNEHGGGIIYIPEGVYRLGGTIYVPSKTQIYGAGFSTVLKFTGPGNCIQYIGDETDYCIFTNFAIEGNAGGGDGFNIYGDGNIYMNVSVYRCGGNGFNLRYSGTNVFEFGALTKIVNCSAFLNGEHGYSSNGILDSQMTNCTFCSNSQKADNTYDNIHCSNAIKISNTHSWGWNDAHGYKRARYALWVEESATITGCHLEGGRTGCARLGGRNVVAGCVFYASFGDHNILISGVYNQISASICMGQTYDDFVSTPLPAWRGCIIFDGGDTWCNGNNIDVSTSNIPIDFANSDGMNIVRISGDTVYKPVNLTNPNDSCYFTSVTGVGFNIGGANANVASTAFKYIDGKSDEAVNIGECAIVVLNNSSIRIKRSDCYQGAIINFGVNGSCTVTCDDGNFIHHGTSYTSNNEGFTIVATDTGFIVC